jgi:hypothetical protein
LNFKKPKPRGDFFAFEKNSPTNFSEKAQMKLPGFNFKTSGLTAGRMPARQGEVIFQGQSAKAYPIPGSDPRPPSLAAFTSSSAVDMIRLGTVEKTTKKARHTLSHRSLRSPRLFQKVTFIRRIVQAKQRTNQKKKLQEIFVTTFPTPAEKRASVLETSKREPWAPPKGRNVVFFRIGRQRRRLTSAATILGATILGRRSDSALWGPTN